MRFVFIMNNLTFEKVWQENDLIELKITAVSKYVQAFQYCYIQRCDLLDIAKKIKCFISDYTNPLYLEFGKKEGNYTPSFAMCLFSEKTTGHIKVEVDVEIDDNFERKHRCKFYVYSELGLIEQLVEKIILVSSKEIGYIASLNND